jgi:hypothetical protein
MPKYSAATGTGKELLTKLANVVEGGAIKLPPIFPGIGEALVATVTKHLVRAHGDYWELRFSFEGIPFANGTVHVQGTEVLMETTA